jgi:peroxiredoxin
MAARVLAFVRRNWFWLIVFAFLGFSLARRSGYFLPSPSLPTTTRADRIPAPEIAAEPLEPGPARLSDYRGRVVLVNFWATWCPPCRAEMPSMQTLYEAYRDRGFVVLAVSGDSQGREVVGPFVGEYRLSFPVLLDPRQRAQLRYGVGAIPTSFVVDRRGRVVSKEVGAVGWDSQAARALVERLLGEPTADDGA